MNKTFYEIDNAVVNKDVVETKFTCDLEACKGACCTMESEYGAPIEKEEIEIIEKNYENVKDYLPERSLKKIEEEGFWEEKDNTLMLKSIDNRDCVFVYFENDIAKCSIEKAYFEGKSNFRKPISCHLFPIRVSDFGGPILRYEHYSECRPALIKGLETNLGISEFCKDAIERLFDKEWYQKLEKAVENNKANKS